MEEIKQEIQEDVQNFTKEDEKTITELSEKQKRYKEIQEKRANKKRLTVEEKIFLKEMELSDLKLMLAEQLRKEKSAWAKKIFKQLKPELERLYNKDSEDLDLKIICLLIKNLENFENVSDSINIGEYFVKNSKNKMVRIKKEM